MRARSDEIGNISSSNWRREGDRVLLEMRLRHPMFGGWRNYFYYGFNEPLADVVSFDDATGEYVASATFGTQLEDAAVGEMTFKLVLPEGASGVSVAPFEFDVESSGDTYFSFLDVVGRPVVVLRRAGAVAEHNVPVVVRYRLSTGAMMAKPARVIGTVMLAMIAAIFVARMSACLRISRPSQ